MRIVLVLLALTLACGAAAQSTRSPTRRTPPPAAEPPARDQPAPAWLGGPHGPMGPPAAGFDMCVTPHPPDCARRAQTQRSEMERRLCEAQTTQFIARVFAYRGCLEAEITRAVRGANETLGMVRCGRPSLSDCPAR